jgi:hypothetical protein
VGVAVSKATLHDAKKGRSKLENRSKCLKLGLLRAGQFRGTQEVIL